MMKFYFEKEYSHVFGTFFGTENGAGHVFTPFQLVGSIASKPLCYRLFFARDTPARVCVCACVVNTELYFQ